MPQHVSPENTNMNRYIENVCTDLSPTHSEPSKFLFQVSGLMSGIVLWMHSGLSSRDIPGAPALIVSSGWVSGVRKLSVARFREDRGQSSGSSG